MLPELGQFSLILSFCLSIILGTLPLIGAHQNNVLWMSLARPLSAGVFVFLGISIAILTYTFANDDFSVQYVALSSNSALPLQYKLSAVWGGHEGSFLLWTFMLAGWMLAVAIFSKSMPIDFAVRVLGVLGILCSGYILFMLATSNPFDRIVPLPPLDGTDLNPMLQDFAFIIHPPTLYMGYVGFSVVFAFAIAALLSGRLDAAWARWSRPWANLAWAILTIGIAVGSWWAYYELGWGGWWGWDPVENPSLITWLFGTALIHSLAVTEKRGVFKNWTVLLAILTFAGSLLGTFITRSGLVTSVHAFASDPSRGLFILAILGITVGGSLLLYAFRAPLMKSEFGFDLLSREIFLLINNVILVVASASIFLGTLFPMVYQALTDDLISIGPPYFNSIFAPLIMLLILFLGIGPMSRWKRTSTAYLLQQLGRVALASVAIGVLLPLLVLLEFSFAATVSITLAAWVVLSIGKDVSNKITNKPTLFQGLRAMTLSYYGMQTAHLGVAVMLVGIGLSSYFSAEKSVLLEQGQSTDLAGYDFVFIGSSAVTGPNFLAEEVEISVLKAGVEIEVLHPQRRIYTASGTPSTEMGIDAGLLRDLFITLGEEKQAGAWSMTIYVKPFIQWIWLGTIFMVFGGTLAAGDKRYRRLRQRRSERAGQRVAAELQPAS
ncbi:MAG: heme lyase CcmF/NrfE family subunit [Gammaproteobacteria bacterium]|jgi:cytochrome c-type biogenesis protein CcmF|nr:heme lyase CcmF/NrfE family subunit [Gammaproteobacteria bacterium]